MKKVLTLTNTRTQSRIGSRLIWPTLLLLLLLSIAFVAIPVFLIPPFRAQTQRPLEISYLLRTWSPLVPAIVFLTALRLTIWRSKATRRECRDALLLTIIILSIVPA